MNNLPKFKSDDEFYQEYRNLVLATFDPSILTEQDEEMLLRIFTSEFIDRVCKFFDDFEEGRLLEEDTKENRIEILNKFMNSSGLNLKHFLILFDKYEELIVVLVMLGFDEESPMAFLFFQNIAKIIRFAKGEEE